MPSSPMRAPRFKSAALSVARSRRAISLDESARYEKKGRPNESASELRAALEAQHLGGLFETMMFAKAGPMQERMIEICNQRQAILLASADEKRASDPEAAACDMCASHEARYIGELVAKLVPART